MKHLVISLAVAVSLTGSAIAAEAVKKAPAPIQLTEAEMAKVVAAGKQNNWSPNQDYCFGGTGSYDCNPSGKGKYDWNNK